jgi:predicted O-linked N-acetylglucosamine transferase (SPINDLY family)
VAAVTTPAIVLRAIDYGEADRVVTLSKNIFNAQRIIAREEMDLLFYTDIGMDPETYFLSFARLAPVQCVTWGHPDTTGVPNVDYFLSSA